MSKDIESVIAKISKLLAMAEHKNSNPNEAARAASMAAKMMNEYQVERKDVIRAELESGGGLVNTPISDLEYSTWPVWMQGLAINTANLFECQVKFKKTGKKKSLKVMGYEADVMMVVWMYEYLHDELTRLATRAVNTNTSAVHKGKIKNSFLSGAVSVLKERFQEIIDERLKDYKSTGTGLMVVKSDAIKEKYGIAKYRNTNSSAADPASFYAGKKAARNVNINRPLGNGEKQKSLGN